MAWGAGGGFFSLGATVGVLGSLGSSCSALVGLTCSQATASCTLVVSQSGIRLLYGRALSSEAGRLTFKRQLSP